MAMQKAHSSIPWVDYPKLDTPLNAQNLLKEDKAIDVIDDRVISLDTTKFDKTEAQGLFKDVELDPKTGIITFTTYSGEKKTIDTLLEKIAINFDFDEVTQKIIVTLEDGTTKEVDLKSFITQYEFLDSETIAFTVDTAGKVTAIVKNGSINENHLRPDYLADIRVESAKAESASAAAELSAGNAKKSETAAAKSATDSKNSADASAESASESAQSADDAESSANTATNQATSASNSAKAAQTSEKNAATNASNAQTSAETATRQATAASGSASTATTQANNAKASATQAADSAKEAESYAHGETGTRENEDTDNSEYYYEQVKHLVQGMNGIVNMGTVKFAELPKSPEVNHMYNISDAFTSDDRFQDGSGIHYAAGNNVVWTGENKWDVLAASSVTGVKGSAEPTYRTGNVNITKNNIGLGNVDNTADANKNVNSAKTADKVKSALTFAGSISETFDGSAPKTVQVQSPTGDTANNVVSFTSGDSQAPDAWTNVELIKTGETHRSLLQKISKMFKNVRWLFSKLGETDITGIGDGTVTGAISALNSSMTNILFGSFTTKKNGDLISIGHTTEHKSAVFILPTDSGADSQRVIYCAQSVPPGSTNFKLVAHDTKTDALSTSSMLSGYFFIIPV